MARRQYNWDHWFLPPGFVIFRGKDYECSQSSMVQQIRNEATKRRIRITVDDHIDHITAMVRGSIDDAEDHPPFDDLPGDTRIGGESCEASAKATR
jgi:hypothetical protein